jgi:hypothetical protein
MLFALLPALSKDGFALFGCLLPVIFGGTLLPSIMLFLFVERLFSLRRPFNQIDQANVYATNFAVKQQVWVAAWRAGHFRNIV